MSELVRRLPWGVERHVRASASMIELHSAVDVSIKPGEFTLHSLLNQFFLAAETRIADVCSESKQVSSAMFDERGKSLPLAFAVEPMFETRRRRSIRSVLRRFPIDR